MATVEDSSWWQKFVRTAESIVYHYAEITYV